MNYNNINLKWFLKVASTVVLLLLIWETIISISYKNKLLLFCFQCNCKKMSISIYWSSLHVNHCSSNIVVVTALFKLVKKECLDFQIANFINNFEFPLHDWFDYLRLGAIQIKCDSLGQVPQTQIYARAAFWRKKILRTTKWEKMSPQATIEA